MALKGKASRARVIIELRTRRSFFELFLFKNIDSSCAIVNGGGAPRPDCLLFCAIIRPFGDSNWQQGLLLGAGMDERQPPAPAGGDDIIFEFTPFGAVMRVVAMDPKTLTEVTIQGPVGADLRVLQTMARRRLAFVLNRRGTAAGPA
jgi:hypothetical protein